MADHEPSTDELRLAIRGELLCREPCSFVLSADTQTPNSAEILRGADLNQITAKKVRRLLEQQFQVDLYAR